MILLGITIVNKVVFKKHIESLCRSAQHAVRLIFTLNLQCEITKVSL